MTGVIAFWDYPPTIWSIAKSEKIFMNHFRLTMKSFSGSHLIIVDSDNQNVSVSDVEISFDSVASLDDAFTLVPSNADIVFIEQSSSATKLDQFYHPSGDTYYVVGSDYGGLPDGITDIHHTCHTVEINLPTSIGFYSYIALGIVLNDRYQKEIK